jgi:hypothetical protein
MKHQLSAGLLASIGARRTFHVTDGAQTRQVWRRGLHHVASLLFR